MAGGAVSLGSAAGGQLPMLAVTGDRCGCKCEDPRVDGVSAAPSLHGWDGGAGMGRQLGTLREGVGSTG